MLRLPRFDLRTPKTLQEAASILTGEGATQGRARPVAGGTDLWPNMKRRHQTADVIVSLNRLHDLRTIQTDGDDNNNGGDLHLGATATLTDIAEHPTVRDRYPALATAIESISSPPLRNMGTIGGNICLDTRCTYYNQTEEWRQAIDYCMKEAGKTCWVAPSSPRCWAHSASDSAPILTALGASIRLVSTDGERTLPLADLYRDDGIQYLTKRPDELVTEIIVPGDADRRQVKSSFLKLRRRGSIDFAVLSVAAALRMEADGTVTGAQIVLGGVSSRPAPATKAAESLIGKKLTEETIAQAAKLARRDATPMDNTDFQPQWRGMVVPKYVERALRECR